MAEQLAFEVNVKNIMHRAHSTHGEAPLFATLSIVVPVKTTAN